MDQPPAKGTTQPVTPAKRREDSLATQRLKLSVAAL